MYSRSAWETGIWAWDTVHQERVLLIPSVIALLGDNPMQSELACHIGSMGKFFCRICHVKGSDLNDANPSSANAGPGDNTETQEVSGSERGGGSESVGASDEVDTSVAGNRPVRKKGQKAAESMEAMVQRVKRFFSVSPSSRYLCSLTVESDI